ncbi:MAG: DNA polymerase III subunit beta [Gemmataceae bacterium]
MKLDCEREALLQDCQIVAAAAATRDVKPILRHIKAMAHGDHCTLMATDLELGIRLKVRSPIVVEPGDAILPANRLLSILRESSDERLIVKADAERVIITGANTEFEMPSEDPHEFPDIPQVEDGKFHELTAGTLREMIRRTVFAAAKESTRYAMTGVLWELEGSTARLVATDSKRLALAQGEANEVGGHDTKGGSHLVPTKAMALLERNLFDDSEPVRVTLRPNDVLFQTGKAMVYSRLVEGRYPPYKEILPKRSSIKVPLAVMPFMSAVRQAAIMTDEESKRVMFRFAPGKLTLQAQGAATGRSKVEMPIEFDGTALEINFDPHYVIDLLKVLPEDAPLMLEMNDANKPALFRSGPNYQYLVMPLS